MTEQLKLKRLAEPQELPLSLGEAKTFLRVDESATAEIIAQTWRLTLDRWPERSSLLNQDWEGWREGADIVTRRDVIEIPRPPLQSVTSFRIFDTADTASEVATTVYFVDTEGEPGRVGPRFGQTWPVTTLRPHNGIQITFVAGYGVDWNAVPDALPQAVRLLLAHFYEDRGACDQPSAAALPASVQALLRPYRVWCL
jgi:uncharacterized phiE125 gp8 family phage protein